MTNPLSTNSEYISALVFAVFSYLRFIKKRKRPGKVRLNQRRAGFCCYNYTAFSSVFQVPHPFSSNFFVILPVLVVLGGFRWRTHCSFPHFFPIFSASLPLYYSPYLIIS